MDDDLDIEGFGEKDYEEQRRIEAEIIEESKKRREELVKLWETVRPGKEVLVRLYDNYGAVEAHVWVERELECVEEEDILTKEVRKVRMFRGRIGRDAWLEFKLNRVVAIAVRIEAVGIEPFVIHKTEHAEFWKKLPKED